MNMNLYFEFADVVVRNHLYPRYGRITGLPDKEDPISNGRASKILNSSRVWKQTSNGVEFLKNTREPVWTTVDMDEFLLIVLSAENV